jgi:hypothetical protein
MQAVGRECLLCNQRVSSAGQGFGCTRCDVVVHGVCAREANPSYRETKKHGAPCPQCDVDLRAEQRQRDAEDAQLRDATRPAPTATPGVFGRSKFLWGALGLGGIAIRVCLQLARREQRRR